MTFTVTIKATGHQFECTADETILAAGLRAGLGLPHGCKNGACGACKSKIITGQTELGKHQERTLTADEAANGFTLICCATAHSNITLEVREVEVGEFASKKLPTRIAKLDKLSDDVMLLALQLPATEKFNYRAGQYIDFLLRDGKRRSYSMANAAHTSDQVSLHIRHMPGGLFTDQVFSTLKERDILRIEGPQKPIVFVASGTGFAPIKAMMEDIIHQQITRPISLYWGGRRPSDLYLHDLCIEWTKSLPHFTYVPVISDALVADNWSGRTGFVHQAVLADLPNMADVQVYACGAPIVIDSAKRDFVALAQLPAEEFYADSFISEADLA